VHFSAEDLARTTIAAEPDPLWELVLSLHKLQQPRSPDRLAGWREHARAGLDETLRRQLGQLTLLVPPKGNFADFLTPNAGAGDLPTALEVVSTTSAARLRTDLAELDVSARPPAWVRALADGDAPAMRELLAALSGYFEAAIAPYWTRIQSTVDSDRALRAQDWSVGGVEGLLAGLPGPMWWEAPILHTEYPKDRDLHLDGRGITLIPSYFCQRTPVTFIDERLPPVLVYPLEYTRRAADDEAALARLIALLGDTRARVLRGLRMPRSTSELARWAATSAASASKHATVLREAGLVSSVRRGNTMRHTLTPLGQALLDGDIPG
jgi:DNA-binding transcriptional ArsR family regulator